PRTGVERHGVLHRRPRRPRPNAPGVGADRGRGRLCREVRRPGPLSRRRGPVGLTVGRRGAIAAALEEGRDRTLAILAPLPHDETMLATIQLREAGEYPIPNGPAVVLTEGPPEVCVPTGSFVMGTSDYPWAYDNERPAHEVHLPAFWIDTVPVTNRAYLEFMA